MHVPDLTALCHQSGAGALALSLSLSLSLSLCLSVSLSISRSLSLSLPLCLSLSLPLSLSLSEPSQKKEGAGDLVSTIQKHKESDSFLAARYQTTKMRDEGRERLALHKTERSFSLWAVGVNLSTFIQ